VTTTTDNNDISKWLPWVAVAVLAYFLFNKPTAVEPVDPTPTPIVNIGTVTKQVLLSTAKGFADVFEQAAAKVEDKSIKTDKELFDFVQPATAKARVEANKPFDMALESGLPRNEDGTFAGKESEVAKLLRQVAKAWN